MSQEPSADPSPAVIHNLRLQRFEIQNAGADPAVLEYKHENARVVFTHTYVPENLRGQGIAAILTRAALDVAREQCWKIEPRCSYVAAYINRHAAYADLQ